MWLLLLLLLFYFRVSKFAKRNNCGTIGRRAVAADTSDRSNAYSTIVIYDSAPNLINNLRS